MAHFGHFSSNDAGTFRTQKHFDSMAVIENPLYGQINIFREQAALTCYCSDFGRSRHDEQFIRYNFSSSSYRSAKIRGEKFLLYARSPVFSTVMTRLSFVRLPAN